LTNSYRAGVSSGLTTGLLGVNTTFTGSGNLGQITSALDPRIHAGGHEADLLKSIGPGLRRGFIRARVPPKHLQPDLDLAQNRFVAWGSFAWDRLLGDVCLGIAFGMRVGYHARYVKEVVTMNKFATLAAAMAVLARGATPVTFHKDVLPILQKNCQTCHRPGEIAPMSFLTYQSTRPWAKAMKAAVVTRKMPPWGADPRYGQFANDPSLTDAEINTIGRVDRQRHPRR
jgi:hypothetical protein